MYIFVIRGPRRLYRVFTATVRLHVDNQLLPNSGFVTRPGRIERPLDRPTPPRHHKAHFDIVHRPHQFRFASCPTPTRDPLPSRPGKSQARDDRKIVFSSYIPPDIDVDLEAIMDDSGQLDVGDTSAALQ